MMYKKVKLYENHAQDSRIKEIGDVCNTMTSKMGAGGNNVPLLMEYQERRDMDKLSKN